MTDWLDAPEPGESNCEECEYWDHEEGNCGAFVCSPFCEPLPCEEGE